MAYSSLLQIRKPSTYLGVVEMGILVKATSLVSHVIMNIP